MGGFWSSYSSTLNSSTQSSPDVNDVVILQGAAKSISSIADVFGNLAKTSSPSDSLNYCVDVISRGDKLILDLICKSSLDALQNGSQELLRPWEIIIQEYNELMNRTCEVIAEVFGLCSDWNSTVESFRTVLLARACNQNLDVTRALSEISTERLMDESLVKGRRDDLKELIDGYGALVLRIQAAQEQFIALGRKLTHRKYIVIGALVAVHSVSIAAITFLSLMNSGSLAVPVACVVIGADLIRQDFNTGIGDDNIGLCKQSVEALQSSCERIRHTQSLLQSLKTGFHVLSVEAIGLGRRINATRSVGGENLKNGGPEDLLDLCNKFASDTKKIEVNVHSIHQDLEEHRRKYREELIPILTRLGARTM